MAGFVDFGIEHPFAKQKSNMDYLDDIPVRDGFEHTDDEKAVLREYFGGGGGTVDVECTPTWGYTLKVSGYAVVLYAILGNPWINNLVYKIPYLTDNPILAFCAKAVAFMFIMIVLSRIA